MQHALSPILVVASFLLATSMPAQTPAPKAGDAALGTIPYEKFESTEVCATCHVDIGRQHEQAMMSQAFTHAWDEI